MKPIPAPKKFLFFGSMLSVIAAGGAPKLHLYVDKRHKELGPIYREKIGPVSGVFVADGDYMRKIFASEGQYPKHIVPEAWLVYNQIYGCKRGLLFMDDKEWLTFRKILNNLMLKAKHDEFCRASEIAAENLIENWRDGESVQNLEQQLYKWSLEVILAVMLGPKVYMNNKAQLSSATGSLSKEVHKIFIESSALSLIPIKMAIKFKLPVWKRFVLTASSTITQGTELVETLLKSIHNQEGSLLSEMLRTGMNIKDVKRIVTDLILAAGDTTAHTMQWLLHLLSINHSAQTDIYNELRQCQDIFHRNLLKGSLKEALRLYPVAPFITRFMPEDTIVDEYLIKRNELVLMSLYSSGRNDKYFPNPDAFQPDRWLRSTKGYKGVTNPNASLPFAMGARSCIGKKIAETQILVTISKILEKFVLKSNRSTPLQIVLHLTSVPEEPVVLHLEKRM